MSTSAIVLMIVSMLVVWGGLVLAVLNLQRSDARVDAQDFNRDL